MRVVELNWLILSDMCGLGCAKWHPDVCNVLILKAFPPRRCVSVNLRRIVLSAYYVIASPETNMSLRVPKQLRHCEVVSDQQTSQWLFAAKQPAAAGTDRSDVAILCRNA